MSYFPRNIAGREYDQGYFSVAEKFSHYRYFYAEPLIKDMYSVNSVFY